MNRTAVTYPCSCEKKGKDDSPLVKKGFCTASIGNGTLSGDETQGGNSPEQWPVYEEVRRGLWGRGAGLGDTQARLGSAPSFPLPSLSCSCL